MRKELFLGLALVVVLSGCSMFGQGNKEGGETLTPEEAKTKAKKFVDENLIPNDQMEAKISDFSSKQGLYKMGIQVGQQSVDSYMTKDGQTFFPQAIDMNNPQQLQQQGTSTPQAQQQMSPSQRAESMISQSRGLLDQYGDSLTDEEKSDLEGKVKELEELNNAENTETEKLQGKMEEVQKATQPLIKKVMEQQQGQSATSSQTAPQPAPQQ